jgi:hypothetical protein
MHPGFWAIWPLVERLLADLDVRPFPENGRLTFATPTRFLQADRVAIDGGSFEPISLL